jgi:hypothetical protein
VFLEISLKKRRFNDSSYRSYSGRRFRVAPKMNSNDRCAAWPTKRANARNDQRAPEPSVWIGYRWRIATRSPAPRGAPRWEWVARAAGIAGADPRGRDSKLSKVRFDDFLPSWCIRRAPAWDNRSTRGVRSENLSKSGALQRIGIALAGIVIHRQTVD